MACEIPFDDLVRYDAPVVNDQGNRMYWFRAQAWWFVFCFAQCKRRVVMRWRSLKCCVAMVLFCVGVGWIFGYGLAWGVECNKKRLQAVTHCDANYDAQTYCVNRDTSPESSCTSQPGAAGFTGISGDEWSPGCDDPADPPVNSHHCVLEDPDPDCLQKYNCTVTIGCESTSAYTPTAWYTAHKAISPSCTPAE